MCVACLLGAIQAVANKSGKKDQVKDAKVEAQVHIGEAEGMEGFAIGVDLKVSGVPDDVLQAGHEVCKPILLILLTSKRN
jgi:organic hydroperoxide reductase OsmC/OhrA